LKLTVLMKGIILEKDQQTSEALNLKKKKKTSEAHEFRLSKGGYTCRVIFIIKPALLIRLLSLV